MILPFRVTRWRRTASRTCRIFNIAFNSPEKISTSTSSRPRNLETKCSRFVSVLHLSVYLSVYLSDYQCLPISVLLSISLYVWLSICLLVLVFIWKLSHLPRRYFQVRNSSGNTAKSTLNLSSSKEDILLPDAGNKSCTKQVLSTVVIAIFVAFFPRQTDGRSDVGAVNQEMSFIHCHHNLLTSARRLTTNFLLLLFVQEHFFAYRLPSTNHWTDFDEIWCETSSC